ncbi:MAG: pirin family protein [Ilumatobacter sp.]|uniref:pirin family protein n=1 Tax=Ilumatobacter sp. TaxID=1967498 RepID=UPI0026183D56|nr:pirin family protein [Ilumatobacter sp.]MDJ0767974.1 pirin family protein [Ilumatobacter sp.]
MTSTILQRVPLGFQWPTTDPFLFCVHHLDRYPAADDRQGPAASLIGRELGSDFAGTDGWRMYHGQVVPGFPAHPHRGFETITYVRQGLVDHADSLGAAARYGRGDVQWMTAGRGIVHAEMFPLLDRDGPNTLELFQVWLNLPAADKMVEPHFSMLWDAQIPRVVEIDDHGRTVEVTVIAGALGSAVPPAPPPASWASRADAELAIWHVVMDAGTSWTVPAAGHGVARTLYVFDGGGLSVGGELVTGSTGAVVDAACEVELVATGRVEILVLQGRPLGEPVAQYGPFVMNTRAEIRQAFDDYQRTGFGGWPWDRDDPVHGIDGARFARRADGSVERAVA